MRKDRSLDGKKTAAKHPVELVTIDLSVGLRAKAGEAKGGGVNVDRG